MELDFAKLRDIIVSIIDVVGKALWRMFKNAVDSVSGGDLPGGDGDQKVDDPKDSIF